MRFLPLTRPMPIYSDETAQLLEEFNLYALPSGYRASIAHAKDYPDDYLILFTNFDEELVTNDEPHIQAILHSCVQHAKSELAAPAAERLRRIQERDAALESLTKLIEEGALLPSQAA